MVSPAREVRGWLSEDQAPRGQMTPSFEREAGLPPARPAPANGERAPPPASGDPAPHPLRRNPPPASRLRSPSLRRGNTDAAASGPKTPRSGRPGRTEAAARPARLPPPLSGECLPGWGAADANLGATRAGYAHALITRGDPRRAHSHSKSGRAPRTLHRHLGRPGRPRLAPSSAVPGRQQPHGRGARAGVCTLLTGQPAGGAASRQNKHPLPCFLLLRLGPPA